MISLKESFERWWAGLGDSKDYHQCSDCNGSGKIIEAYHADHGYIEHPGSDETWAEVQEDNAYIEKRRIHCTTCDGTGSYHYDKYGNFLPGKSYRFSRAENNGWVDYHAYIKSKEWRVKATEAKRRAGWRCQVCNRHKSEVTLAAHHRTYERLGEELASDITVLCRDCHELYEQNRKQRRSR